MLQLSQNTLEFSFPAVRDGVRLKVTLQRTLRIPDDGKTYPLPPGLGVFPARKVDDFKDKVPASWVEHGGIFVPLYQSEALWISFRPSYIVDRSTYPFAVKVTTGKVSAVTGEVYMDGLQAGDYLTVPPQPWLDGYYAKKGTIKQFVAAPLGGGFTAEEQITGKDEFGGIQLEVFPMKVDDFNKKFPERVEYALNSGSVKRSTRGITGQSAGSFKRLNISNSIQDMGLAAGGSMKQEIYKDPHELNSWDTEHGERLFIHLVNSMVWRQITGEEPPSSPRTAAEYTNYGLSWFDYYSEAPALEGSKKLDELQTMKEVGEKKGVPVLPENQTVEVPDKQTVHLGTSKTTVRDGKW